MSLCCADDRTVLAPGSAFDGRDGTVSAAVERCMNAIETRGLKRTFGNRTADEDLTVDLLIGTVFGFLGLNGAGKTTNVRMLAA